jgi:hypothetical protein
MPMFIACSSHVHRMFIACSSHVHRVFGFPAELLQVIEIHLSERGSSIAPGDHLGIVIRHGNSQCSVLKHCIL